MRIKKVSCLVLVLALLVCSAACGDTSSQEQSSALSSSPESSRTQSVSDSSPESEASLSDSSDSAESGLSSVVLSSPPSAPSDPVSSLSSASSAISEASHSSVEAGSSAAGSANSQPSSAGTNENQGNPGKAPVRAVLVPKASGTVVLGNASVEIDVSNKADGYIMIKYTESTASRIKVQITAPGGATYSYDIVPGRYEVLPLSGGNGSYTVGVYKNIEGTRYSIVCTDNISVSISDPLTPFLYPNQYVNFDANTKTVQKAEELTKNCRDVLSVVKEVYAFVVDTFTYDKEKAATVQSGYLPNVDVILASKKGICFDYAAVMTAMLRSSGVPTRLIVGYATTTYHAWISVYSEETGWIDNVIYFDGKNWKRMDPTFASTGKASKEIMKFIETDGNYTEKFRY